MSQLFFGIKQMIYYLRQLTYLHLMMSKRVNAYCWVLVENAEMHFKGVDGEGCASQILDLKSQVQSDMT